MYVCLGLLVEDKKKDKKIIIHKVRRFLYSYYCSRLRLRCYFIYPYLVDNKIYCTVKPWQCCTSLTELSDLNASIVGVMSLKSFLSQSLHLLLLDAYSGLRTSRQTNGDNFQNYLLWWFLTMVRLLLHVKYDVLMSNIIWITIFNFVQYLELYTLIYMCEWEGGVITLAGGVDH